MSTVIHAQHGPCRYTQSIRRAVIMLSSSSQRRERVARGDRYFIPRWLWPRETSYNQTTHGRGWLATVTSVDEGKSCLTFVCDGEVDAEAHMRTSAFTQNCTRLNPSAEIVLPAPPPFTRDQGARARAHGALPCLLPAS